MPVGKVTIFDKPGAPFEMGEFPTPEVEPGGLADQEHRCGDLWFRPSYLARRHVDALKSDSWPRIYRCCPFAR